MKTRWMLCGALLLSSACHRHGRGGAVASSTATPQTDDERTLYVLGTLLGERISEFNLSPHELAVVERGLADQVSGATPLVAHDQREQFGRRLGELSRTRGAARAAQQHEAGQRYLVTAAAEPGAQRLPSGVIYRELQAGTGAQPAPTDEVSVNYRGTLIDGTEFDSTYARHQPASFPLGGVIPCWTEGLQRMHIGGRARLVCPPEAAYGDRGQRQIPPGSTLIFEVELISAHPAAPAPQMGLPGMPGGTMGGPPPGGAPATSAPAPH